MEKWTTLRFVTGFFNKTLGRKRVHGTYRILEGDHCKLLVRATTMNRVPDGNELIAIDLSDSFNSLIFWKSGYSRNFSYRMSRRVEEGIKGIQSLPEAMLTGEEENILNSGIVDINSTHVLIEIGDKPFLLHKGEKPETYCYANQVPQRMANIRKAQESVKDPIGDRQICNEWWACEMPVGFVPSALDPELVKVLSTSLNPLDFGFNMNECRIAAVSGSYQGPSLRSFIPKKKLILATPQPTKVKRWLEAVAKWSEAADMLLKREPSTHKGLSVHNSRYQSIVNDEERLGTIIVTKEGVFITGEVHAKADWSKSDTLTQWYKLTQHANQITIPQCT